MPSKILVFVLLVSLTASCGAEDDIKIGVPGRGRVDVYCGLRCVRDLLEYRGQSISLMSLMEEAKPSGNNEQYSMEDLKGILARHGVDSFGLGFSSIADLRDAVPCIIHYQPTSGTQDGHFVLLIDATEPLMTIHDGLLGTRQIRSNDPELPITKIALVTGNPKNIQSAGLTFKSTDFGLLFLAVLQTVCVTFLVWRRRMVAQLAN